MRICDSYKCKRMALGWTQADIARLVGVSSGTISRFENGEELSESVFNSIRYGIENYIQSLSREEYLQTRLLEEVLSLRYQNQQEQLYTLQHMSIHSSKLAMDILRPRN